MNKRHRPAPRESQQPHARAPKGYVWLASLAFLGYALIGIGMDAAMHRVHWLGGLAGAVLGGGVGCLIWFLQRKANR